jgi:soluble lytic murein transglycosylase-like protein
MTTRRPILGFKAVRASRHVRGTALGLLLAGALFAPGCASSRPQAARSPTAGADEVPCADGWPPGQRDRIAAVQPYVKDAAKTNQVDAKLINAVIWVESKFDARARGPGGTQGLMQLMPATARELADRLGERSRPMDPGFNVRAGTLYLAKMIKKFGDVGLGLAAYHGGAGHVLKWQKAGKRGVPDGSKKYVDKVYAAKKMF